MRTPTASKIALAIAAAVGMSSGSPIPLTPIAGFLRAGQAEVATQRIEKRAARLDAHDVLASVHLQRNLDAAGGHRRHRSNPHAGMASAHL